MPRAKRAAANSNAGSPATPGHNSKTPLTDEERDALGTHFALKVIEKQRIAAQKKADYDAANAEVSGVFKLISKELGETRKDFERDVIAVMGMTEAEYLSAERKRLRRHQMAGAVPQGAQLDLVERINDTVDDAINAESDGYRAGRRADDPEIPSHISSMFASDWMRGYHAGQEFNTLQLGRAAEILARPKPGTMAPAAPEPEADEDADLDDAARALKRSGWTDPAPEEQSFAAE